MSQSQVSSKRCHVLWIKPSHYDDDGYLIRWYRSSLPANSLASVYAIAVDCAERRSLGPDVEIRVGALDETNTRIDPQRLMKDLRKAGGHILIGLVGVQSNQYPRALDLAREFRALGAAVAIGGFHVSGTMAMIGQTTPELREALDLGCSLFAGELEGRLDILLKDLVGGGLKPIYNYLDELPDMTGTPTPILPLDRVRRTMGRRASFDAGRGCPFQCSFCTIINVQGRKSRHRNADDVERLLRANLAQGITNFFITDDNFARNGNWEQIFDRLIELQKEGLFVQLVIQVDTQSHRIPRFIDKASKAGVTRVFLGLENINPDSLKSAQKGQNKITDYRAMLQAWHRAKVLTYAGYILGFPTDTPDSIRRDIEIIKRELPLDILELFILTPLPGSLDHQRLVESGARLDPDLNKYDVQHVVTDHALMSKEQWQAIYREAWDLYYSPEHIATVLRRARTWGYDPKHMLAKLFAFHAPIVYERMHPLEGGLIRIKRRRERRPGLPIVNPLMFYPKLVWEFVAKYFGAYLMHRRYGRILKQVMAEPADVYADLAIAPVEAGEESQLELYNATAAAREQTEKHGVRVGRRAAAAS